MDERERQEIDDAHSEWLSRLVPASNEEIIGLAQKMWADPELRAIFERVGYDGDTTEAEEVAIDAAINSYRQEAMRDRDDLHLALASCLARQLADGMIDHLDSPKAKAFLENRKVLRAGGAVKMMPTTASEVMDFARAMRREPDMWEIFQRIPAGPMGAATEDDMEKTHIFRYQYLKKYGLYNRDIRALNEAGWVLRSLAQGEIDSLDSSAAWAKIRKNQFVVE